MNYAKRQVGNKVYGGQSSHLPLKLNMSGVIPPIFASSIILFPATAAGWHFLTGEADAIEQLTRAAGFRYAYDPTIQQFAHASGVVVATPDGRLARYLYGVEYAPKDLKLALFEAAEGRIGGLSEKLMLLCFNYDAALGKYTVATLFSVRVAGAVTLAALIFSMVWMLRSERRLGRAAAGGVARS